LLWVERECKTHFFFVACVLHHQPTEQRFTFSGGGRGLVVDDLCVESWDWDRRCSAAAKVTFTSNTVNLHPFALYTLIFA
jgi:hypothetical protein